jgi:hypothetical protein
VSITLPNYRKITDWSYSKQGNGADIGSTRVGVRGRETCHLRELHNSFMIRIFRQYYSGDQIKQDEMGGTCSMNRIVEEILVGKPKVERILRKHK